jgi:hypothetical protein
MIKNLIVKKVNLLILQQEDKLLPIIKMNIFLLLKENKVLLFQKNIKKN